MKIALFGGIYNNYLALEAAIEDAQRRDFTINTLLMNCEGGVYDPLANGLKDIEKVQ